MLPPGLSITRHARNMSDNLEDMVSCNYSLTPGYIDMIIHWSDVIIYWYKNSVIFLGFYWPLNWFPDFSRVSRIFWPLVTLHRKSIQSHYILNIYIFGILPILLLYMVTNDFNIVPVVLSVDYLNRPIESVHTNNKTY